MPVQILESTRYADGGLKTARVAFIARDVPALGYRTYHVFPMPRRSRLESRGPITPSCVADPASRMNTIASLSSRAPGRSTSLLFKPGDWEVFSGPGNVVARQQDRGDLWELYKGLDGGSRVAMTTQQKVPKRGEAVFSDEGKGEPGTLVTGPVLSESRGRAPFGSGRVRDDRSALHRPAPDRGHDAADQSGEVRPLPGALPDNDQGRQEHARDPVRVDRPPGQRSSSPRRTGSTTAMAHAGSPCSTSACPATSCPTAP